MPIFLLALLAGAFFVARRQSSTAPSPGAGGSPPPQSYGPARRGYGSPPPHANDGYGPPPQANDGGYGPPPQANGGYGAPPPATGPASGSAATSPTPCAAAFASLPEPLRSSVMSALATSGVPNEAVFSALISSLHAGGFKSAAVCLLNAKSGASPVASPVAPSAVSQLATAATSISTLLAPRLSAIRTMDSTLRQMVDVALTKPIPSTLSEARAHQMGIVSIRNEVASLGSYSATVTQLQSRIDTIDMMIANGAIR